VWAASGGWVDVRAFESWYSAVMDTPSTGSRASKAITRFLVTLVVLGLVGAVLVLLSQLNARTYRLEGVADAEVEIERLNPSPPKDIPDDDALVTQVVKTDTNGYFTCTLDEPGWWGVMVSAHDGSKEKDGKSWPIVRRGILWVRVQEVRSAK
jgi:hypothetical protein